MKKQFLLFLFALLPMLAMADDSGSCGENLTWTYNSTTKTLTIQGSGAMKDYSSSISSVPWRPYDIRTAIIEEGVTSIGKRAFYYCSGLTFVTISNSVTSIGDYAFEQCSGLTSVIIGNSVTSIGEYAFWNCSSLTSVTIPNSVTSIGRGAFQNCSGLTSIIIPNSVTSIGNGAFYGCSGLTSVTIPNSVTSIGEYAFWNCSSLTSVTIPNSVTSIGDYAFQYCSGLTSITIPNSVTSIGSRAFYGCSGLTSVEFHCPQIGSWFSGKNSIKEVIIGNEVTSIGDYAFSGCSGLTSVTIPNSVTSIGNQAFKGCTGLTSITIPNSVTSIGYDAFYDCSGLSSVEFHCAQIGSWFSGMTSIEEVIIGNEVTSIGDYAFYGCSGLTSVEFHCPQIGSWFKGNTYIKNVIIGNEVTSIGSGAFQNCSGLQKVIVPDISAWFGISFADNSANPLNYAHHIYSDENTEITDLVIPDGVTSIGSRAFYGCSGLTSVTIPNGVTSIGARAFEGCLGLQKVIVPDIAAWCAISFANNIANPLYYVHHIYSDKNTEITEIVIPEGVNIIGQYAFYNCENITSVTIPSSVTSIGKNAFSCGIKLSTVNVNMNIPIEIDESVFEFTGENYSKDIIYLAATLNVPIGSKALYSNVKGWSKFANIHEVDFTPIHKLTYLVDDEEYKVYEIAEGATITPEPAPTKEGYTFSGWSEIPETMPAYDVTVTGSFAVNQYLITYMIGDEVYQKEYVDYGATIVLPNVPEREGYSFAWIDAPEKTCQTMTPQQILTQ